MTEEISKTPDVFISYKWDIRPQVQKLRDMLEEEGYICWMDRRKKHIGWIGGGDCLFEGIDTQIGKSKVIHQ